MDDKRNILFNSAAKAGLILGGVSIIYVIITTLLSKIDFSFMGVISFLLWLGKFVGCIALMKWLMKRFSSACPQANNSGVFKFGRVTALLSSLVFSAFYMAFMLFIEPDMFKDAFAEIMNNPMIDAASADMLNNLLPQMPTITFIVNFIYCYLFGLILSAILSRNIPARNPFSEEN